jgi:hypothetical protein
MLISLFTEALNQPRFGLTVHGTAKGCATSLAVDGTCLATVQAHFRTFTPTDFGHGSHILAREPPSLMRCNCDTASCLELGLPGRSKPPQVSSPLGSASTAIVGQSPLLATMNHLRPSRDVSASTVPERRTARTYFCKDRHTQSAYNRGLNNEDESQVRYSDWVPANSGRKRPLPGSRKWSDTQE